MNWSECRDTVGITSRTSWSAMPQDSFHSMLRTFSIRVFTAWSLIALGGCEAGKSPQGKLAGTESQRPGSSASKTEPAVTRRSLAARLGAVWTDVPADRTPRFELLDWTVESGHAIWGSSGRDDLGRLYFGVAVVDSPSAYVLQYDPRSGEFNVRGDVVQNLRAAGIHRDGESQMKIHSKFWQADDGYLYFASMDETGEKPDGSAYPTWGGHLWRIHTQTYRWEHVLATKEALIALAGCGRWIYALGYFHHVVYQYDTQTGQTRSYAVGSVGGHVSRNLLVDKRAHVYVPRVRAVERTEAGKPVSRFEAHLVELNARCEPVQQTPLEHYEVTPDFGSHGITAFTHLRDGSCVLVTSKGYLYHIVPPDFDRPAAVEPLGWFHPRGEAYATCLFTFAGKRYLVGQAQHRRGPPRWITYDLQQRGSHIVTGFPGQQLLQLENLLIFGTHTRDDLGNAYLVGQAKIKRKTAPIIIQVAFAAENR